MKLSWPAASGATNIQAQYSTNGTTWYTLPQSIAANATEATLTGLNPGTTYTFRLNVVGGANAGVSATVVGSTVADPITTLSVGLIGPNSVKLSWTTAATGASLVRVERSLDGGATWATLQNLTASTTTTTVSGLTPNTAYKFRLNVVGGQRNGPSNEVNATTSGQLVPSFTNTAKTDTTAAFRWTTLTNATAVGIEQSTDNGVTWTDSQLLLPNSTTATSIAGTSTTGTVTGLSPNTTYQFRIAVTGGIYGTEGSNGNRAISVTTNPTQLSGLSVSEATKTSMKLSWPAASGATNIQAQYSTNGTTWYTLPQSIAANATEATLTGLNPGTTYTFRLNVVGGANAGASATVVGSTVADPITTLSVGLIGPNSVKLSWTTAATGASLVRVERSLDGGATWATLQNLTASTTTTTVSGLTPNTAYKFRLNVVGGQRNGPSNEVNATTSGQLVPSFTNTAKTDTTAAFRWTTLTNATAVGIEQSTDNGVTWTDSQLLLPNSTTATSIAGTSTTATVTGLSPNTTYQFRIAVTGGIYGTEGNNGNRAISVTTNPTQLSGLSVSEATKTSMKLSWPAASGATNIQAQYSTNGTTWYTLPQSIAANATEATLTGLNPGTTYTFRLNVVGGANAGASTTVVGSTVADPITTLSVGLIGPNSVKLSWTTAATGASLVRVERSLDGGATWATLQNLTASTTTTTVSGLTPNTAYKFRLNVVGGQRNGPSNEVNATTSGQLVPSFTNTAKTDTTAAFRWTTLTNATAVGIEQSTDNGVTWTDSQLLLPNSTTATSIAGTSTTGTVTGLSPNTTYQFRIAVTGGIYGTEGSNGNRAISVTTNPTQLSGLSVSEATKTSMKLSWPAASGATNIQAQYSTNGTTWYTLPQSIAANATEATLTGLNPGTTYTFRLNVVGGANAGASATVVGSTVADPITTLSVGLIGPNSVKLSWTTAATGASLVRVERSLDGGATWATLQNLTASTTTTTVSGLTPNTAYKFRLNVVGGQRNGPSNEVNATTSGQLVPSFTNTAKTDTTAAFRWTTLTNATAVGIEQSTDNGVTWTDSQLLLPNSTTATSIAGTSTTATVTGLSPNTTYQFRIAVTGGIYGTEGNNGNRAISVTTNPTQLSGLSVSEATKTSMKLSWPAASGATNIQAQYSTNGTTWYTLPQSIAANATEATLTGLNPGTTYTFRLNVVGGANAGASTTVVGSTVADPITTLSVGLIGPNSVKLSWTTAATGASLVRVERSLDGGATWATLQNLTASTTTTTVSGLTPNTAYKFRLNVVGGQRNGPSNEVNATTSGQLVPSFTNTAKTDTTAAFRWTTLTNATAVGIEQSTDNGVTWTDSQLLLPNSTTATSIAGTSTTATVTGLSPNTTYQFRIAVTGGIYGTEGSNGNRAISVTTNPTQLSGLSVSEATKTSMKLSWPAASGATNIQAQYSTNGTTWYTLPQSIAANATEATLTGLNPGTTYTFRLNVVGGANAGASATVVGSTVADPITTLSVGLIGPNSVKLSWTTAATGASLVRVERSLDGGATWATLQNLTASTTTTTVSGLTPNTAYKFRLNVVGGQRNGPSNEVNATTSGQLVPSFTNTAKTDTTAAFRWTTLTNATAVGIEQSTDNGVTWTDSQLLLPNSTTATSIAGTSTTATVTGLSPNTTYQFRIAVTGGIYGTEGNNGNRAISVTTNPTQLSGLSVSEATKTSMKLSWPAASGATNIQAQYSTNGTTWYTLPQSIAANATEATLTGLNPGTTYTFRLNVVGGANAGASATVVGSTVADPITTLSVGLIGPNSVKLSWTTAATGASLVRVERSLDGGATWATLQNLTASTTTTTVSGLTPNTAYKFRLNVVGGQRNGPSNEVNATTSGQLVPSFTNTAKTDTTAAFRWTTLTNATAVGIEQSTDNGVTWTDSQLLLPNSTTATSIAGTSTTATVTGLSPNTTYQFRIAVTGGIYGTEGSNGNRAISVTTNPTQLSGLSVSEATKTSMKLSWPAASGATNIQAQYSTNGTTWYTLPQSIAANATEATLTGLNPGTTYTFRLNVVGGANAGASTTVVGSTVADPITTLSVGLIGPNSVKLNWSINGNNDTILLQKSEDGSVWSNVASLSPSTTSYIVSALTANKDYEFRLIIAKGPNAGTSNIVTAHTSSLPITTFRSSTIQSTAVTFVWSAGMNPTSVTIEYMINGEWSTAPAGFINPAANSATVSGLTPLTTYNFRLVLHGGQYEGESSAITVITKV